MSDLSEELPRPGSDGDQVETCVVSGAGMHFPWLRKHLDSVAAGGKKKKDFAQTTGACLSLAQEALLQQQWPRAAEFMYSYLQTLEDSDSSQRQAAPNNVETFSAFADQMKNIGVLNYLKAIIFLWADKDDYAYNTEARNILSHSWKTSVHFSALIKTPGVWDPFVKSYVEMLEFYGDQDGARKVLTNYAYDEKFPSNPNAHIYLYNFLKRAKAPRSELLSVLKILYQIVPSHKLMLEFHLLLRKSEKEEHRKLGLEVLFSLLDFAGCTKSVTAWRCLASYLRQTLMANHLGWVQEEWESRRNWWPTFHFSYFWAKSDWKEDKDLAYEKAFVAGTLLGKGCKYFRYILKQDHQDLRKKIKQMKKSVRRYSIVKPAVD
ncbi:TATA box-binding protein-associated factor RNA polymerase I subunit A [Octodon degus]|uniref:TATA box-binding protein-associated factor RNA polymerase I subunit A n=1 Tax=Octodon degus TaxID=10160 RepID=A0A6P6E1S6_OCTDE|nr:TATA box-binding protein-associated factor RNA polymerase I subunit A [Octodon degus]